MQINLPFSKQRKDLYFHWNAGTTILPDASSARFHPSAPVSGVTIAIPQIAGSVIWRTLPMLHLMLEGVVAWPHDLVAPATTEWSTVYTLSPGMRGGWNFGDRQLILGLAVPVTWSGDKSEAGVFGYFSYELPFRK